MDKKLERHNQTVLVIEGHPYSLVREINPVDNYVCDKCALKEDCWEDDGNYRFHSFCIPDSLDSSWFFIEDWDIIKTPLVCYCTGCEMCTDSDKCAMLADV